MTGDSLYPRQTPAIKASEVGKKPTTKIILGDWPWHPNRDTSNPRLQWHNYAGIRYMNMLFGDGHVQYWRFPKEYNTDPKYTSGAVNMNDPWW